VTAGNFEDCVKLLSISPYFLSLCEEEVWRNFLLYCNGMFLEISTQLRLGRTCDLLCNYSSRYDCWISGASATHGSFPREDETTGNGEYYSMTNALP
jgi:hypothetical protein